MTLLFALLALGSVSEAAPKVAGGWTCNAIGYEPAYGGGIGRRRDVYGPEMPTEAAAQTRAVQLCMSSGLMMCGIGSCSQLPFSVE